MIGIAVATILVLGVLAQWTAWRVRLPSILLLLLFGFIAGPVALWVNIQWLGRSEAEAIFLDIEGIIPRDLLLSVVSMAVGVILFEGGLTLNFADIRTVRRAVLSLVTIGALVTWIIALLAARYILGLSWPVATLLGAILVVTGPTVIGPLLRFVRPTGTVGKVLKWEGIVIDPIGALLAVLVFEAILAGHDGNNVQNGFVIARGFAYGAVMTSVVGSAIGLAAAGGLIFMVRRFLVPDQLQVPVTLAFVIAAFSASNAVVHESGLFATTILGITLANQKRIRISHILEFKETLTLLLVAILFIVLSARLRLEQLARIDFLGAIGFMLVLIVVARPLGVLASTVGTKLTWRDKLFLMWMAPRGIVAALISSVFGLALVQQAVPVPDAQLLTPYVFLTIVVTVTVYGLPATLVARRLGLANPKNAGFIIGGATDIARSIAHAIHEEKIEVLVVDLNYQNIQKARLMGLPTQVANILSPQVLERIELTGIGRMLALTPNNEVNSLASVHFARHFGRSNVFQLAHESDREKQKAREKGQSGEKKTDVDDEVRGRTLFGHDFTYDELQDRMASGAEIRRTKLTREFTLKDWQERHGEKGVALFLIDEAGSLQIFAADRAMTPRAGQVIISLVLPQPEPAHARPKQGAGSDDSHGLPGPEQREDIQAPSGASTDLDSTADARAPAASPTL